MTDIHSCSYCCERPECIKAQRDEMRGEIERLRAECDEIEAQAVKNCDEVLELRAELAAIEAQERERCAKIADGYIGCDNLAAAIRGTT